MDTFLTNPVFALTDVATAQPLDYDVSLAAAYPKNLVLDWTDYCNAKCFFCRRETYEQTIGGQGGFIPLGNLKMLEKVLSQIDIFCISSAIGEPLLHPELDEFLTWLYSINPSVLLQVVTNGTTLTADKAPLFANHLDWFSVSLNAANAEAHMRDMFPHLVKRGIDAKKRWALHLRHLEEFLAALPPSDRSRVRFQMVAHRHNVRDVVDFVRLVKGLGGSHAVITNIAVHPETVESSLYWVRDQYNQNVDEACVIGAQLGVRVDAARFFTSVKPVLDLEKMCRDPLDVAYISRSSSASPCCHWTEAPLAIDFYEDAKSFDRYWNSKLLHQLRQKRSSASCQVCGMSRVFDEISFHFSPKMKQALIAAGRLSELEGENEYPDVKLVASCIASGLDLSSIRHTLLQLGLPVTMAEQLTESGLNALPELDSACWTAFKRLDAPRAPVDIPLARPFLGIGWGAPIYEFGNRQTARPIGAAQAASIFVRIAPAKGSEIRFTIHHLQFADVEPNLEIEVCGRAIAMRYTRDETGCAVVCGIVPDDLAELFDGRLWIRIGHLSGRRPQSGQLSFARCEISDTRSIEVAQSKRSNFARAVLSSLAVPERTEAAGVD